MSDLIDRQAAIDALNKHGVLFEFHLPHEFYEVKKEIRELPSVQPETVKRTEESEQNVSNDDLISRKAAIDAIEPTLKSILQGNSFKAINVIDKIRKLPSAQPDFSCDGCQTPKHICGICMRNYPNIIDHYCTGEWAERRTDGSKNE